MKNPFIILLLVVTMQNCMEQEDGQEVIDAAIASHGFDKISSRVISFDFRNRRYSLKSEGKDKIYIREFSDDSLGMVKDVLTNSTKFNRYINDTLINVNEEWSGRYGSSVNSVLYFFQLPYGLNDPAVQKKFLGKGYINGQVYDKVEVTFEQEGGGEDHDDEFIYWIHAKNKTLDFMAYSYETDGGGVRFRQAINRRKIGGMVFQDYVNYKPKSKNVDIEDLDKKFESGKLLELSRIINENIKVN